jgi:hypothetical protein
MEDTSCTLPVRELILRNNHLTKLQGSCPCPFRDFYLPTERSGDNQTMHTDIFAEDCLQQFSNLQFVDVSSNGLTILQPQAAPFNPTPYCTFPLKFLNVFMNLLDYAEIGKYLRDFPTGVSELVAARINARSESASLCITPIMSLHLEGNFISFDQNISTLLFHECHTLSYLYLNENDMSLVSDERFKVLFV